MNHELLRDVIKRSGKKYEALAKECNMDRGTLYNKCYGLTEFKLSEIDALSKALHLTVEQKILIFLTKKWFIFTIMTKDRKEFEDWYFEKYGIEYEWTEVTKCHKEKEEKEHISA